MANVPAIGPEPEEFRDFEAASRPRRPPLGFGHLLALLSGAAVLFLTATLALGTMQWFKAHSSDNLLLGAWRSDDHPKYSSIVCGKGGYLALTPRNSRQQQFGHYRFQAQYTIEFVVFDEREHVQKWKLQLTRDAMTTTDTEGVSAHWQRQ